MKFFVNFNYIIEVLLAELVFLSPFPHQKRFIPRLLLVLTTATATGCFEATHRNNGGLFSFLCMTALLGLTVLGMKFAFHGTFLSVLAACTSGVALQHISHHLSRLVALAPNFEPWNAWWEFVTCLLLDVIVFLLLIRPLRNTRYYEVEDARITAVSLLIVLLCTGLTRLLRLSGTLNGYGVVCTSLYAITCCALALFIQFFLYYFVQFKSDYLLQKRIREEEQHQYELSREKDELINIKCHDLKHTLQILETQLPKAEIDSMRELIDAHDSTYHTGLDVLDTILNEKSLRCRSRGIDLTYMGPGEELGFLDDMDLYSMFGNILENAITAADQFQEKDKRVISMTIERKGNFVLFDTINYLPKGLEFTDGLPQTTKTGEKGYHGYGLKSIREIARRYQGDVSISTAGGFFRLSVYFMSE